MIEAYVDEVRKLEEHFDGIQAEHIPRAENDIADYLSKRAGFKLRVELGTFLLRLTQPFAEPSTEQKKRRKSSPDKYFPAKLLEPSAKMLPWTLRLPWGNRLRRGVKPWL